jgi:osmotically-inducible protein OsmY
VTRNYSLIFGASVLAIILSSAPGVVAQTDAPADTEHGTTLKDKTNDMAITAKVKAALAQDQYTSGAADAIHVETNGGVAILTGDVAAQAIAEHAQMVVARLSGVRDVVNDLKYPRAATGMSSAPIVVPPAKATTGTPPGAP